MTTQPIVPYLTVNGAAEGIAFYQKAFGATEQARMMFEDGKRIMHAELLINGGRVFLSDPFPEFCGGTGPADAIAGSTVAVVIDFDSPAKVDATFARAVEAGATGESPPADQFWGARFATLRDPFGHRWLLNAMLEKAPPG
ncbi:MAG TPA: glyoxalase/bleomycin resistance/extradiol dioxygenase family protein [Crenalkalicoccus sp.]|nr:glyoxalase/bleomycin resistance/extradiol dioxygenase family protein [Crenalkalicoccus sp.]